jgi:hypothetical protein
MTDLDQDGSFEIVARYEVDQEARQAVEALTLRGIGAMSEQQAHPQAPFVVLVVPGETNRAREILGLPAVANSESEPSRRPQVIWIAGVFVAALIILPLIAFFVSFKLSGG